MQPTVVITVTVIYRYARGLCYLYHHHHHHHCMYVCMYECMNLAGRKNGRVCILDFISGKGRNYKS